ncbi:MAG: GcrA family cell cycle regulator [Acetobacteraceae bacterium]
MEWTEELIVQLRGLWDEGRSTAEIGRHIGMSKNAVVGKAHRLNLPPRPSPIRREAGPHPARPQTTARAPTLPPLGAVRAGRMAPSGAPRPHTPPSAPPGDTIGPAAAIGAAAEIAPSPPPAPVVALGSPPRGREMACCWPLGDPGTSGFHFCGAAALAGKPYCAQHAQLAYIRIRERREDAA